MDKLVRFELSILCNELQQYAQLSAEQDIMSWLADVSKKDSKEKIEKLDNELSN